MNEFGKKAENASLSPLGLGNVAAAYWNLAPAELVEDVIKREEGILNDTGALAINTGEFTGRSPKDRFMIGLPLTFPVRRCMCVMLLPALRKRIA